MLFYKVYNEQRKIYGVTKTAILETICICKKGKLSLEEIAEYVPYLSIEELKELKDKLRM